MNRSITHTRLIRNLRTKIQAKYKGNVKAIPLHGSVYMPVGTPDLLIVANGRAILLEAKTGEAQLRPAQKKQIREWHQAGAVACVFRSVREGMEIVEGARLTAPQWRAIVNPRGGGVLSNSPHESEAGCAPTARLHPRPT